MKTHRTELIPCGLVVEAQAGFLTELVDLDLVRRNICL